MPEKSQPPDPTQSNAKQLVGVKDVLRLEAKSPALTSDSSEEEKEKVKEKERNDKLNLIKSKENRKMSIESKSKDKESKDGKSVTEKQTLLRIILETGRKHQIRAQLAHKGDRLSSQLVV